MSEEKMFYDNPKVNEYLDKLLESVLEVRQSIRNRESEDIAKPKFKGLLMIIGGKVEFEVASNVKL
jgi:hypothetical protein